jgi:mannan endo-1,4-beta-mannosidase
MMALIACLALPLAGRADTYSVDGTRILKNGSAWVGGGVNAFDQFGPGGKSGWGIRIVREVIDDFSVCPIAGSEGTRATSLGYLHPLEDVVKNNRAQGMITVLCPFGWDTSRYTQILGATPSAVPWYSAFKTRLAVLARTFANQPDVWIEVWNEPYAWDNAWFTESQWSKDMTDLYNVIRQAGNSNIVLVPGQANGGQETVLLHQGSFLTGKTNVVATIHCYNRWTGDSQASCENRIRAIRAAGWALLFGEVGPDAWVTDCTRLLNASVTQQVPSLGWSWNAGDGSSLVNAGTATVWGKQFFRYLPQYGPTQSAVTGTSPARGAN